MLRDGGLADAELGDDMAHARAGVPFGGASQEKLEDVAPRTVCDHVEDVRHVIRVVVPGTEYHDEGSAIGVVQPRCAARGSEGGLDVGHRFGVVTSTAS